MKRYKFKSDLEFVDIFRFVLAWVIIVFVTFGIGSLFLPFYFIKFVMQHTEILVLDESVV